MNADIPEEVSAQEGTETIAEKDPIESEDPYYEEFIREELERGRHA